MESCFYEVEKSEMNGSVDIANHQIAAARKMVGRLVGDYFHGAQEDKVVKPAELALEAWRSLSWEEQHQWSGHVQFSSVAAKTIRECLVQRSQLEGEQCQVETRFTLDPARGHCANSMEWRRLDEALELLHKRRPRQSWLVEARFFGGLSFEDAASFLGCSYTTVRAEWFAARSWLYQELGFA